MKARRFIRVLACFVLFSTWIKPRRLHGSPKTPQKDWKGCSMPTALVRWVIPSMVTLPWFSEVHAWPRIFTNPNAPWPNPKTRRQKYSGLIASLFFLCLVGCSIAPGTTPASTLSSPPTATPESIPVALSIPNVSLYYPFCGDANDASRNQNHGQVHGPTLTQDRFGTPNCAYYFDGIDDDITFDASGMSVGDSPRTLSAWIKAESFPPPPDNFPSLGSRASVVGWGVDEAGQLSEMQITETRLTYHVYNYDAWSNATVELNRWYHLAIVYTGQKIILYINGTLEEYDSVALDTKAGSGRIGAFSDPNVISPLFPNGYDLSYFHGVIDDVCIFSEALTSEQVISLYHEGGWNSE